MKLQLKIAAGMVLPLLFLAACQKNINQPVIAEELARVSQSTASARGAEENSSGNVYTLSNATSGNNVMVYSRSASGDITFSASYATGGNGTGGGLGNQGAVIIANEKNVLLAVNAGSNSISSFKLNNDGLVLVSTISSGGMQPISLAHYGNWVYVLNAGGTNNISGFNLADDGVLSPIPGSSRPLTAASTGPAQVSFVNAGKALVITEKATNKIVTYSVNEMGVPVMMHSITSSSATPFGFDAGKNENIVVSEAVGGAPGASVLSSYHISDDGAINVVDGSVGAGQSAACWVVITNNGKYAYTTNTANNNISTFSVSNSGDLSVSEAIAATTEAGPTDAALSNNSKYLYVLNGAGHSIQGYTVAANGSLNLLQTLGGLPVGTNGLAAK